MVLYGNKSGFLLYISSSSDLVLSISKNQSNVLTNFCVSTVSPFHNIQIHRQLICLKSSVKTLF